MSENSFLLDQASFLQTRDPSIWGWDQRQNIRFVAPARKHLFNEILEEEETSKPDKTGISTYLRLKPAGVNGADQNTVSILNDTTIVVNPPKDSATFKNQISGRVVQQYTFSKVLGPDTTQKEVFDECVGYQIKDFILGSNCLIFAYGTTNAGKTFTIQGNGTSPGIIPRALDALFKSIRGQVSAVGRYKPDKVEGIVQLDSTTIAQELDYKNRILQWNWDKPLEPIKSGLNTLSSNTSGSSESDFISSTYREMQKTLSSDSPIDLETEGDVVYGVWVSFAEVYNECIFDLLDPMLTRNHKRNPLKMAQDGEGNTFIRDLKMIHVASGDEAFHVMLYGKANLQVAATKMNMRSSRSHCIFTIRLVRYANSDNPSYAIVSSFTFCDLAGAERAKKTLNAGDRLKESNNINSSLHVLGRCLSTIRENQKRNERKPVPYRDSKLTRIFQRALTGHERITMIVNANTSSILFDETVNVLKFSAIARQVVLETPIKKSRPVKKKSRFSIMVTQPNPHGTICWDAPPQDPEESISSARLSADMVVRNYNAQNEELLALVEKLKEQVKEEKEKNLTLERNIRQTMTEQFSKMVTTIENSWKTRLQHTEERCEELSSWRLTHLENYYKQQLEGSRKRRRGSDPDDSIIEGDDPMQEKRIQELEEEVQLLEKKSKAVHELLKEAQDIQAAVSADNTALKFELSNAKLELENLNRQLLASEKETEGASDAVVTELRHQLSVEKEKVSEERSKNENLRQLLDEAKSEFLMLNEDIQESHSQTSKLENELLKKEDQLDELNQQLETTQTLLSQKTHDLEKIEEKFDALSKAHDNCGKDRQKIVSVLLEQAEPDEELQIHLKHLSLSGESSENLESSLPLLDYFIDKYAVMKSDLNGIKSLLEETMTKLKLKEEEVFKFKLRLECQEKETQTSKTRETSDIVEGESICELQKIIQEKSEFICTLNSKKSSLETEVKRLENLISEQKDHQNDSAMHSVELQNEVKLLQKELKNMLQKNMRAEQLLQETKSELENSQTNSSRLEQDLKSALQKSCSQLNMSGFSQTEIDTSGGNPAKIYEETVKIFKDLKEKSELEIERLKEELKQSREENQRRDEQQQMKEVEVATIHAHRSEIVNRYEDALKKVQEELDREKREVIRLRDALYKSTPTPKKNVNAEIRRLKDLVENLQAELNSRKTEGQSSTKKLSKGAKKTTRQESVCDEDSIDSLKENVGESFPVPLSSSKSKRATNAEPSQVQTEKPQRKGRKLFNRHQSQDTEDFEAVEVEYLPLTTPDSYIKRSLRNRKV